MALRLLKANLGEYETRAEILEFALRQPLTEKINAIYEAAPKILGLSVSIWNHLNTLELLVQLEAKWKNSTNENSAPQSIPPAPVVVLGGPEVSHLPESAEIFRHADFIIRGEGENAFRELCSAVLNDRKSIKKIPNSSGKFIDAQPPDLATIDPGYRLYTGEDLTRKLVYVEASRGCPFGCEFCQGPTRSPGPIRSPCSFDKTVREFPLEKFLSNMDDLINRGAKTFKFLDRTFNLNIDRALCIMQFFLERIAEIDCVHFEMIPGRFPPELREVIRHFPPGKLRLEIGIQTFNAETAALINRSGESDDALETIAFLRRETGAIVHADLIAGLPGEDLQSFGAGFDRLWMAAAAATQPEQAPAEHLPFEIQLGILKYLPGTPIGRHTETHGMRYAPEPPYEVLETAALDTTRLDKIKNFARFWEIIINRNAFPEITAKIFPPGEPVFDKFMHLADSLLAQFSRNWGIDKKELEGACILFQKGSASP